MKTLIRLAVGLAFVAFTINPVVAQDEAAASPAADAAAPAAGEQTIEGTVTEEAKEGGSVWWLVAADGAKYILGGDKAAGLAEHKDKQVKVTGTVSGDAEKTLTVSSFEAAAAAAPEGGEAKE